VSLRNWFGQGTLFPVVFYELFLMNQDLYIECQYQCRCDERLKTKVSLFIMNRERER
jgi:hypothetical protein